VLLLGYQSLLQMVLSLAFGEVLSVPMPGYAVEAKELWHHSLVVGMASEIVSREWPQPGVDSGIAFTAGLLHDIGKVAMEQVLRCGHEGAVRALIRVESLSRIEAERKILGTDHAEVGASLLGMWRLPEQIVAGVAHHHEPGPKASGDLERFLYLANCSAHLAGSAPGWEAYALKLQSPEVATFQLTTDRLDNLLIQIRESFERVDFLMSN
jgi:putative nucleotidyltransferase with HDIG domain